jgi:hypothetical protein
VNVIATLDNLVTTLATDANLQAFAMATWGKRLTVEKGFLQRREISLSDLPLIRVTRPQETLGSQEIDPQAMAQFRLYIGFYQPDADTAVDQDITFNELTRATLRKNRRRGGTAQTTILGPTVTDEGQSHPAYFSIMSIATPWYDRPALPETVDGLQDAMGDFLMGADGDILMGAP